MIITIDTSICPSYNVTVGEILTLLNIKYGNSFEQSMQSLFSKGFVTQYCNKENPVTITQEGINILTDIICESDKKIPKKRDLDELVQRLQSLDPVGKIHGYYWKGNKTDIARKLQAFFKTYGNKWTDDQIYDTVKKYVDEHATDPYLKLLKYYISKDGVSQLAEDLENYGTDTMNDFRSVLI